MKLADKIRDWITSDLYVEPGRRVDKWLEKRYIELISGLETKYPNTIGGFTDDILDRTMLAEKYKKKFSHYNKRNLMAHFNKFWISCMERDPRLRSVWQINPSWWDKDDEFHDLLNFRQPIIWCDTSVEITEDFIKKYFERYISEVFSHKFFSKFMLNFDNILAESYQVSNEERIYVKNDSNLMAIKCFANLTYEEVFMYFKNALLEEGNFEVEYIPNSCEDYKGFPPKTDVGMFDENCIVIVVKYSMRNI